MNWNYFIGPGCLLVGVFLSLYVKEKAVTAADDTFTKSIKAALSIFKVELMECFDEKYTLKGECTLMMEAHADRTDINDVRLSNIENRLNVQVKQSRKTN